MAYDDELAERVHRMLQDEPGLSEKRMFGGHAFLVNGNMAVGASSKGGLMLRVDPLEADALILEPDVERFEMRGRQMAGWLHVDTQALQSDEELGRWLSYGIAFARSLAAK